MPEKTQLQKYRETLKSKEHNDLDNKMASKQKCKKIRHQSTWSQNPEQKKMSGLLPSNWYPSWHYRHPTGHQAPLQ